MPYSIEVRITRARVCCSVLLIPAVPLCASVDSLRKPGSALERQIVASNTVSDAAAIQQSLRHDVASHPADFLVFVTKAGAHQFLLQHRDDVEPETNERLVSRGVIGYWQGKTLVVLPWGPAQLFQ